MKRAAALASTMLFAGGFVVTAAPVCELPTCVSSIIEIPLPAPVTVTETVEVPVPTTVNIPTTITRTVTAAPTTVTETVSAPPITRTQAPVTVTQAPVTITQAPVTVTEEASPTTITRTASPTTVTKTVEKEIAAVPSFDDKPFIPDNPATAAATFSTLGLILGMAIGALALGIVARKNRQQGQEEMAEETLSVFRGEDDPDTSPIIMSGGKHRA